MIEIFPAALPAEALHDLEGMERIWILAHLHLNQGFNPKVTPPRGPKVKRGLLATRAPHRPNPIGLSAVELLGISGHRLSLGPCDLIDGTPILDIKPYIPYADAFPESRAGWVDALDPSLPQRSRNLRPKREEPK